MFIMSFIRLFTLDGFDFGRLGSDFEPGRLFCVASYDRGLGGGDTLDTGYSIAESGTK